MMLEGADKSIGELRLLLDTALDAVVVIDSAGVILAWNKVAENTFGWSEGEVTGQSMTDLIIPHGHRAGHQQGMQRYQSTGKAKVLNRRIEITALHREGREFPVELSITSARVPTGDIFIGYLRDITNRRLAERALEDERARADALATEREAILSQLAEAVIVTDPEGRLTFVNEAAARLHGVVKLDVKPEEYTDTYHLLTEDRQPYPTSELPLARAVRGEAVSEARWRIKRPDGTEVLAVGSARPIFGRSGDQVGAVLTARDETERGEAERLLQENEARLRALTDNLPGGAVYQIWMSPEGSERRFIYLSRSYERLAGVPVEAVLADPTLAYNAIEAEDRPLFIEAESNAIRDKTAFDVQARFRRADGEVRWCRFISAPREQPDGSLIWDGLQIDITRRVEAQIALGELNQSLEQRVAELSAERQSIWNISKDLFVLVGFDGFYKTANPAWLAALGYDPEGLMGSRFDALVHPKDVDAASAGFQRLLEGFVVDNVDIRLLAKDGSYRCFSWTCVPTEDSFYAAGRDVTERKLLEEQLRQAQKMEAVGQLTGGIAHDFNNLLTIIRSAADLMRRRDIDDEKRGRYVDAISDTAERASKLTGQLLAFARRQPLAPKVFEVNAQVSEIIELVRPLIGSRIRVEVVKAERAYIEVDVGQFETALMNLAVNARDAMNSEGALTIKLEIGRSIPALRGQPGRRGEFVAISVMDTGSGIVPEHLDKLFEPFFTTKEVGKGTGLGLSQVYGFVQQSGGDIQVSSAAGEGARFTIYLPRTDKPSERDPKLTGNVSDEARTENACVLVVEDNEAVGRFTTETLHDLGYGTVWVANAHEALIELGKADLRFDVVFSDVVMPGINGVQLAQRIREQHPGLPVVLASGYSDVLAEEGSCGFPLLQKPYSVTALSRILREAVTARGRFSS